MDGRTKGITTMDTTTRLDAYAREVCRYWTERTRVNLIADLDARRQAILALSQEHAQRILAAGFTEDDADAYERRYDFEADRAAALRETR